MKKQTLTVFLALLLGTSLAQVNLQPPSPVHTVTFKNGRTFQIKAPPASKNGDGFWDQWSFDQEYPSPNGKFVAVRFVRSSQDPRHDPSTIDLVSQTGSQSVLRDSDLLDFYWSLDSRFLLGSGKSALRLWNISGTLKYKDFSRTGQLTIVEVKPDRQGLCLVLQPSSYANGQTKLSTTIAQVSLPGLKIIRSSHRMVPVDQRTGFCP